MPRNGIHNFLALAVLLGYLSTQHGMRAFFFVTDGFSDVVQQRPPSRQLHIETKLRSHDAANVCGFTRMIEIVLSIACPVLEPPEHLDQLRVKVREPQLKDDFLGLIIHELIDIDFDFLDDLLDPRRMDTPVMHQPFERDLCDLATQRIEARHDDGFRCLINNQVDPGCGFDRTDVAPFPSYDPSLHRVVRNRYDRNRGFGNVITHHSLNRVGNDLARFPLRILTRLF